MSRRRLLLEQGQKNLFNYLDVPISSNANLKSWDKVTPKYCKINGAGTYVGNTPSFTTGPVGIILPANKYLSISFRFFNGFSGTSRRYILGLDENFYTIVKNQYNANYTQGATIVFSVNENVKYWYVQFSLAISEQEQQGIVVVKGDKIPDKYIPYK